MSQPAAKDKNGKFVSQEFLPQVSSDPKQLNEFFDAAICPQPPASSPPTETESSMMVADGETPGQISREESCHERLPGIAETEAEAEKNGSRDSRGDEREWREGRAGRRK